MDPFSKDNWSPSEAVTSVPVPIGLAPISKARVKAALDRDGVKYQEDEDGDIGGAWEACSFFFVILGQKDELFAVRGTWRGSLDPSQWAAALEVCNQWNLDKLWPKTYARRDDEGRIHLHAELNVDYEPGVTDDQLTQHLACAVTTGISFFEHVNTVFPEEWARVDPNNA